MIHRMAIVLCPWCGDRLLALVMQAHPRGAICATCERAIPMNIQLLVTDRQAETFTHGGIVPRGFDV